MSDDGPKVVQFPTQELAAGELLMAVEQTLISDALGVIIKQRDGDIEESRRIWHEAFETAVRVYGEWQESRK